MDDHKMPIGYWVKQLDQLLSEGIDKIQSQFGLSRSDWQIIHSLSAQVEINKQGLLTTMRPFMDSSTAEKILEQLHSKGLLAITQNILKLTRKGEEQHAACLEKQKEFRQSLMKDISREDYLKTVQTLQKMVDNLKT